MTINYNSNIVTSGLILCLDAANPRSYPGSGTNWYDVSGNSNDHTLVNSPSFSGGKFTLNGTNGFNRTASILGTTSTCTVVVWYSTTDTQELWAMGNNSGSYYLSASYGNNYYNGNCGNPTNYVDLNTVVNPATPVNYRNGVYHMWEAKGVDFTSWSRYDWYLYGGGWQMEGSAAVIMVYNRIITAEESAQNFAAYRGRYGI